MRLERLNNLPLNTVTPNFVAIFVFFVTASSFIETISFSEIEAKREAIWFLLGCSEVNSTWIITSGLANQRALKALFTCVVYTNSSYFRLLTKTTVILKRVLQIYYVKVNYEDNWLHELNSIFWNAGKIAQRIPIQNKGLFQRDSLRRNRPLRLH